MLESQGVGGVLLIRPFFLHFLAQNFEFRYIWVFFFRKMNIFVVRFFFFLGGGGGGGGSHFLLDYFWGHFRVFFKVNGGGGC